MKYIFILLVFVAISCAPHYDYFTLGYVQKGMMKASILEDFNISEKKGFEYSDENEKYDVYFQEYYVISSNNSPGGTYDIFVFVFKDSQLVEYGVLEDFRRSPKLLNRDIAKFITEKI